MADEEKTTEVKLTPEVAKPVVATLSFGSGKDSASLQFKKSIDAIGDLVVEGVLKIDTEGISFKSMDVANVAMVSFRQKKEAFVEFDLSGGKELSVPFTINNMKTALKSLKKNETILRLRLTENSIDVLLTGDKKSQYTVPVLGDLEVKDTKLPDLKFAVTTLMESSKLKEAVEDAEIGGESLSFRAQNNLFNIKCNNEASMKVDIGAEIISMKMDDPKNVIVSKYSIEYLKKFLGAKISDKIMVQWSKDYPVKLSLANEAKTIELIFILAPRIENN